MLPVIALILTHSGSCSSHGLGLQQKAQKQLERTSKIKIKIPKLNVKLQKIFVEFQKKNYPIFLQSRTAVLSFDYLATASRNLILLKTSANARKGDAKGEKKKNEQFLEQSKKRN